MLDQTVDELAEAVFFGEHVEGHLAFDGRWTHVKLYLLFLVSRLLDYPLLFEYLNDLLLVEVLEVLAFVVFVSHKEFGDCTFFLLFLADGSYGECSLT